MTSGGAPSWKLTLVEDETKDMLKKVETNFDQDMETPTVIFFNNK